MSKNGKHPKLVDDILTEFSAIFWGVWGQKLLLMVHLEKLLIWRILLFLPGFHILYTFIYTYIHTHSSICIYIYMVPCPVLPPPPPPPHGMGRRYRGRAGAISNESRVSFPFLPCTLLLCRGCPCRSFPSFDLHFLFCNLRGSKRS